MQNWYHLFPKNTGLSLYAWIIFCVLPFYFIFRTFRWMEISIGLFMVVLFFATYRLAFIKKGWTVYVSVGVQMTISFVMTIYFGYVYFSLFLAFFIGNIQQRAGFITLYIVHVVTTLGAVILGFIVDSATYLTQLPFVIVSIIGVILLPFNMYNRNKREKLESDLQDANERISELLVAEERQRIARDLHDTLGQKLSLIGLKSDLAGKLIYRDPDKATNELNDIHQTARTALKEVRDIVSTMRAVKLEDEMVHIQQVLKAAQIDCIINGSTRLLDTPLLVENVLSMCLKEAVTNVVKHSKASVCKISILQSESEISITVWDNGIGITNPEWSVGNGLRGMSERLEFVNGDLKAEAFEGTLITVQVPKITGPNQTGGVV
ncbi:sensor histidine kinase [Bacilli bacterium]|nr:histidine kinase [Bacilli bacterium VT-13-104]PZD86810.1 sensor histidine kinase [Bacilli bacterium]PZD88184.1 sensor histidine kinase [Bacilli bacterium]PZD91461.1 sensor histidine kinase [Bacilli bacterium]RCO06649.1 sensor histidine kinase [Bacilli bacterium]